MASTSESELPLALRVKNYGSKSKLTCVFAPLNAWGHISACIPIAQILKAEYDVNIVFIINDAWKNRLTSYGFQEEVYRMPGYNNKATTNPSEYWTELVKRLGRIMTLSSFEKIRLFGLNQQEQICSEVQSSNEQIEKILARVKPDLIIIDNYVLTPALVRQNIPWIRLRSASPLEINQTDTVPPFNSGYSVKSKNGWSEFKKDQTQTMYPLWKEFNEWFYSATDQRYKLPPGEFIFDSPILNLYIFPKELDYTDLRPMPENWLRIDALIKRQSKEISSSVVPAEFLETAKNAKTPLIYVSLGTYGSADVDLIKNIIKMIHTTGYYCIVVKGPFHDTYDFPSNKFWGAETLPQTEILPLIDVVICHGGNSSMNECFYFGKPMVILPIFGDEYDNAQRIYELSYGIRLDPYNMKEDELIAAVQTVHKDPEIQAKMNGASKRIHENEDGAITIAQLVRDKVFPNSK